MAKKFKGFVFGTAIPDGPGFYFGNGNSGGFNPLDLDPVAFYEPSDASTLFQDAAGSTLSDVGDPVRLLLDKSNGLQRGPELWDTADVTAAGIWTESGGVYTKGTTGFATLGLTTLAPDTWYEVEFTISATTGVLNLWRANAGNEQAASNFGTGSHRVIVKSGTTATAQGHYLWFDGNAFTGTLSNLSFRELPGNHAMAPSDAARPVYAVDKTLTDDGIDDAMIAPLTGTYSAYIAAGGALIADEGAVMADDYDILRDGMTGAVVVSGTLSEGQQQQVAAYFGVTT